MRQAAGLPLLGAAGVLLTVSLFFGGDSSDERLFWIGMGALVVVLACSAAALAGLLVLPQPGRAGRAFLLLLAGYVTWTGISVVWSIVPDRSWDTFNRGLVYLALAVIGVLVGSAVPRPARVVAGGLVVLLGGVVLWALAGKVVPALFTDGARIARLRNPVGYWNALALLLDIALPLFLWLSVRFRGLAALGVYLTTVALALTYSRAGLGFGVVAVALWLWLGAARRESLTALAIALPVALGVAGVGLALPGIAKDLQPDHVRVRDGAWFGVALLVGAIVVAVLARRDLRQLERRALVGATVVLLAAGGGALVARGSFLAQFRGDEVTQTSGRIGSFSSNNRTTWWGEAWQIFERAPAGGKGAGSFQVARRPIRHNALEATEPHDVALQALAETGVFGFLLGGGAAVVALLAAWGAVRRLDGPERAAAVALAIVVPVYLLHALVDIDWEFVAASAPLFLVLGILIGGASRHEARRRFPLLALGAAVLVLACGYSLAAPWLADRDVRSANELLLADPARAVSDAKSAHDLNPLSIEPYLAWAEAAIIRGNTTQALRLYEQAAKLQPENSRTWFDLGAFEFQVLNDPCHAYDQLNHAYTLDPYGPAGTKNGLLDRARAVRNSGRC